MPAPTSALGPAAVGNPSQAEDGDDVEEDEITEPERAIEARDDGVCGQRDGFYAPIGAGRHRPSTTTNRVSTGRSS